MKNILSFMLALIILIASSNTTFSMSSLTIENASPLTVRAYLIEYMSNLGENINIENLTENSVTFDFTRTKFRGLAAIFVKDVENKVTFTFTPVETGVRLTYNAVARAHTLDGQEIVAPTSSELSEISFLESVKINFDGGFLYGFALGAKKKDGGFPIVSVAPNSPIDRAGLKVGDIVTKVDGRTVKYDKRTGLHDFQTTIYEPKELVLTVKTGKTEKTYTVTSVFFDPKTKQYGN